MEALAFEPATYGKCPLSRLHKNRLSPPTSGRDCKDRQFLGTCKVLPAFLRTFLARLPELGVHRLVTYDLFVVEYGSGRQYEFVFYRCSPPVRVRFFAKNFYMYIVSYQHHFFNGNMRIFTTQNSHLSVIFGTQKKLS